MLVGEQGGLVWLRQDEQVVVWLSLKKGQYITLISRGAFTYKLTKPIAMI